MKRRKPRDDKYAPSERIRKKWWRQYGKRRMARLERLEGRRQARDRFGQ